MIFITGANGLLGNFVLRSFIENGPKEIVALKRKDSDLAQVGDLKDRVQWVEGDILDIMLLEKQTKGAETIIHCAGKVSFDKNDKQELYQVNVEGTRNIVNASLVNNVRKLVHVSSISTFGGHKSNGIISENTKKNMDSLPSYYAVTKYLAELEVWRGNTEGLNTAIINPSVILGPGNWQNSSVRLFDYVWKENKFFTNGYINCVDARDVADIIVRLCHEKTTGGEQYIVNSERISYQELFANIARQFNKKPPAIKIPQMALDMFYALDQFISIITGKKAIVTKEIKNSAKSALKYSSDKIKRDLGIEFYRVEETIEWTCQMMNRISRQ